MTYTGQCACGAVKLSIAGEALAVRQCWCKRCQRMTGGGAAHNAMFATDGVTITGTPAKTGYTADSGTEIVWEFCGTCGTPIMAYAPIARPQFRTLRLGVITQPHDLAPQIVIWTSEAPAWAVHDPKLSQFAGQPAAPNPKP